MEERWRPVKGYEGEFLVSDLGRVMNNHGLVLRQIHNAQDNLCVSLKGRTVRVAKAVAQAFVANPNGFEYQGFKDGNKENCRADNIEWIIPDFSNDGMAKAIDLVKDGEVYEMYSIGAASRWLNSSPNTVKNAANNKEQAIRVNGYYVAWANDTKRINQLIAASELLT